MLSVDSSEEKSKLHNALGYAVLGSLSIVTYCYLSYALEVPGCPTGYKGAGGRYDGASHPDCTGGSHRYVDVMVLGSDHFYSDPTCKVVYGCQDYDPEGIVGSLSASFLAFLGLLVGKLVKHYGKSPPSRRFVAYTLCFGLVLLLVGGSICCFSQNTGVVPINKNLWSPSFIFVCAGFACFLFSLFYGLMDLAPDGFEGWDGWPLRAGEIERVAKRRA